ncbi:MAG: mechanosensitive ion channel [Sedimentisphaerales bacterium]|nr:mechanosensitive ion channel [Sedimentisphaerales bacterium]
MKIRRCPDVRLFREAGIPTSLILILCVFFILSSSNYGQEISGPPASASEKPADLKVIPQEPTTAAGVKLTVETLESIKKTITDSPDVEQEQKNKLLELYDQAIAQLKTANESQAKKEQYLQARQAVPSELERIKGLLAKPIPDPVAIAPAEMTLQEMEQARAQARAQFLEARKNSETLENEPRRRTDRRTRIPEEVSATQEQLAPLREKLTAPVGDPKPLEPATANRYLQLAQTKALEARIEALREERLFYDAAPDLLSARRDLAARETTVAQKHMLFWEEKVGEKQRALAQEAQQQAVQTVKETKQADPVIQTLAEENAALARQQTELIEKIETAKNYLIDLWQQVARWEEAFRDIKDNVERAGGVTNVLGVFLLGKRNELPDLAASRHRIQKWTVEIAQAQLGVDEYDRAWVQMADLNQLSEEYLSKVDSSIPEDQRGDLRTQIMQLLEQKRKILRTLSDSYEDYSATLASLDVKERQLVKTVSEIVGYIDEHVLWVRSSSIVRLSDIPTGIQAVSWLVRPSNWNALWKAFWQDLQQNFLLYMVVWGFWFLLLRFQSRLRARMGKISELVGHVYSDGFLLTVRALGWSIACSVVWPVLLLFLAWRLQESTQTNDFIQALSRSLVLTGGLLFLARLIVLFFSSHGLVKQHFHVPDEVVSFVRRHLYWFFSAIIPLTFLFHLTLYQQTDVAWHNTLGRWSFFAVQGILAAFLLILLRPQGVLIDSVLQKHKGGWLDRLGYLWYGLCVVVPVGFIVAAGMGYFYTAQHLFEKAGLTILFLLIVWMVNALLIRWMEVAQKKLAIKQRRKQMLAAQQKREKEEASSTETQTAEKVDEEEIPLVSISQQTQRLIRAFTVVSFFMGTWWIWRSVLPALTALEDIGLWRTTDGQGNEVWISLGTLTKAFIILGLSIVLARNVPGLLEIVILQRLPLERGARFAITSICRYLLVVIGIVMAFSAIGIGWAKVQWLIAAMTVGLGFGLQEIFANFISGLIILFEQPIRVGDVVTIGDVNGKVSEIRIRATTIRKWDQRELIVPNKEFITGRLINWSLSDTTLRMEFKVGIAYGSDIRKAERTLYRIARDNPLIIHNDPAPTVVFRSFGDSTLDFELRLYVPNMDNFLKVWHEINCAIDTEFRKAGIEIAFPQRDLHIRSVQTDLPFVRKEPPVAPQDL